MDFAEYEKMHQGEQMPVPEYITQEKAADFVREQKKQENAHTVDELKASIHKQLEAGNGPQYVLYAAIKAIGILTKDKEWQDDCIGYLDEVYADLQQQSFIEDNAALALARLEEMKEKYNAKLRKQLSADLNGYRKIQGSIDAILSTLNEIDPPEIELFDFDDVIQ